MLKCRGDKMRYNDLQRQMLALKPPVQPWLQLVSTNFKERTGILNPYTLKGGAGYYEFISKNQTGEIVLLPDTCYSIIFECDSRKPRAFISGIQNQKSNLSLKPNTLYFGIKPFSLFGIISNEVSSADLADHTIDLDQMYNTDELLEKILQAHDFEERIKVFEDHYQENWLNDEYMTNLQEIVAVMICLNKGLLRMEDLEKETNYSMRYCRKRFNESYNLSPKQYASIVRFQYVMERLAIDPNMELSDLAQACGYFDQAHLTKDFKKYSGHTPKEFIHLLKKYLNSP